MSIQIVEIAQPSVIDTVAVAQPSTVAVVEVRQGPAGAGGGGSATWGGITGTLSAQTDLQTALNLKAPLASPSLTGTPTAPTATTTTSTTQVATTAFVQQELASGVAVAKNLEVYVRNMTGASMPAGTIVYINGANGNRPTITKARANSDANSAQTFGFTKTALADGGFGFVIVRGELENVNTNGLGEGTQLYLSPSVAGNWTTTKPSAPEHLVYVGIVVKDHPTQGIILVAIQNGYELNEIHDVSISSPAAGQVIKRNAGNTLWINSAIVSADVSDATSTTSNGNLALRDPDYGTLEAAAFIATDANEATGLKGLSTLGSVNLAPNDSAYDNLTFGFLNYIYVSPAAASAHRTALGSTATGDALFTAVTPKAARTEIGQITATSTAQINSTAYTAGGTPVTGLQSIQLEADTLYELSWYGKFTSNGGSGYLWLNFSSAIDDLGHNGFQQFGRFHTTVANPFLVSTTAIAAAFANLGTQTNRTAHGSIVFKTVLATQVSLGWSQWNTGTIAGTSSLLTAFRVGIRPV